MPTATFIHDGDAIDHTPTANVVAGDVVKLSTLFGVAKRDIPANTLGALAVRGVFRVPTAAPPNTVGLVVGQEVYWDDTLQQVQPTNNATGTLDAIGRVVGFKDAAADPSADVLINV